MKRIISLLLLSLLILLCVGCDTSTPEVKDGATPYIQDGYWYIDGVNTQIRAEGLDGKDGVDGKNGLDGQDGADGKDGIDGKDGVDGKDGLDGKNGIDGKDGLDGKDGVDGKNGIDGKDGLDGKDGTNGKDGLDGKSAYELFCEIYGYEGTEEQWLTDLINGGLIDAEKPKTDLTIAVYGDSISTKAGKNAVEITITERDVGVTLSAYPTYYDLGTTIGGHTIVESDIGYELTFIPTAQDVGKTVGNAKNYNPASTTVWWEHLEQYFDCNVNAVCYSSSSYCSHEESNITLKTAHAWHDSQIRKLGTRVEGSMTRIPPDVVILYRGCNDMTHSPYATLTKGYFDNVDWAYPSTDRVGSGWGVLEAMSLTIMKIREAYPDAKIVIATQATFKRIDRDNFPCIIK